MGIIDRDAILVLRYGKLNSNAFYRINYFYLELIWMLLMYV